MGQLKNFPPLDNYFRVRLRDFKCYLKCRYPKLKLIYFPIEGRGEPIRLLLRHAKVDFQDIRLTQQEFFGNYIKETNAKQLPELKMGCKKYNQTAAIMKMLGSKYGYLPLPFSKEAPMQRVLIEKVMGSINDLWTNIGDYKFVLPTPEAKQKSKDTFTKEKMPTYFGVYEEMLKNNSSKEFIVGNSYTVADFYMVGFARGNIFKPFAEVPEITTVLEKYPLLKNYLEIRNKDFP